MLLREPSTIRNMDPFNSALVVILHKLSVRCGQAAESVAPFYCKQVLYLQFRSLVCNE